MLIGVELFHGDLSTSQTSSLGAIVLKQEQLQSSSVSKLREELKLQLATFPADLTICSKEG